MDSIKIEGEIPGYATINTEVELKMYIDVNKVKTFIFVKDDENYVVDFDKLIELGIVKKEKE